MAPLLVLPALDRHAATWLDLRLYAKQAGEVLAGASREEFLADQKLRDATMFNLVRIAEAVRRLPAEALTRYPDIDWSALGRFTAERAYEMTEDDGSVAWRTVSVSVPALLRLDVPSEPAESDPRDIRVWPASDSATLQVAVPAAELADLCRRWRVAELAVFGSALREDFGPDSDVDLLVTFQPDAHWGLFDRLHMQDELAALLGRRVDLVERCEVEASPNWIRRRSILNTARQIWSDDRP